MNQSQPAFSAPCHVRSRQCLALALLTLGLASSGQAQTLIYKEDFNTEGEGTRYTVEGRGFVPKNGQAVPVPGGSSYWTRNVDVVAQGELVGVPAPAPARRALISFNHRLDPQFLTEDGKKLINATINWLTDGKKNMVVMFSAPRGVGELDLGDTYLFDTLTAAGHTVIDDDTSVATIGEIITQQKVDLIINSSTGGDPIRIAGAPAPMLSFAADLIGDLLLATRGDVDLMFNPGDIKIEAAAHPIAAGLPSTLQFVTDAQPFDAPGLGVPTGSVVVASYQGTDANSGAEIKKPFIIVTEKGDQLLGGILSGFEGTGFWGGADLNEPNIADGTFNTGAEPRSLTLNPVNVAGKDKVKLTFALAGTEIDFDGPGGDDFLRIKADIDGDGPAEFVELATYGAPTGTEKFLIEMTKNGVETKDYTKRIGIVARDLTYDIPEGATQLVIRFEALSTFWNEIMAFDNIRITSGDTPVAPSKINIALNNKEITLTWTGSAILESANSVTGPWTAVTGAASGHKIQTAGAGAFYRLRGQ